MPSKDQDYANTLPIQPGMVLSDKYRVERLIAAGGMGAVLAAHHEVLDQPVAIKLMRPELASSEEAAQRFLREARAAARIESDYVARVTDVDIWEGTPFMVMELLQGNDLDDVIEEEGNLTVSDAVDYVMQALAGLHAAHALGVIHRDLKPSNLFLVNRANGAARIKILDFGISKVVGDDSEGLKAGATTSTEAMLGTPRYMSPEQVSSAKNVDVRTDLWAMGLILYELLTKSYPFEGDSAGAILAAILTSTVPPARDTRRDVPVELDAVIAKLLQKERRERYKTAKSVMVALAPFASRRVQALLLEPEELRGALAATETQGTPSDVLGSAKQHALDRAEQLGLAATAISSADLDASAAATARSSRDRSGPTDTSMAVAGVPSGGGGTTKIVAAVAALAGVIGAGIYLAGQDDANTPVQAAPQAQPSESPPLPSPLPTASASPSALPAATPAPSAATSAAPSVEPAPAPPPPAWRPPPPPQPEPAPPKKTSPKPKDLLNDWD